MSRQGGFKTPASNGGPNRTPVIACPWHRYGQDHPGGAPDCGMAAEAISLGRVMPLGDLVTWMARAQAEVMMVVNTLIASLVANGLIAMAEEAKPIAPDDVQIVDDFIDGEPDRLSKAEVAAFLEEADKRKIPEEKVDG